MKKLILLALGLFVVGSANAASYVPVVKTDGFGGYALQSTKPGSNGYEPFRIDDQGVQWRPEAQLFDDFMGRSINTTNWYINSGTGASASIIVSPSGLVSFSTANNSGGAGAVSLQTERIYRADKGGLAFETKLLLNNVTSSVVFGGFVNATSLTVPGTISGNVMTVSQSNYVGLMFDNSSTTKAWACVGSKDSVSSSVVGATVSATTSAVKLRVNVDSSGNAECFVNATRIGRVASAVSATSNLSAGLSFSQSGAVTNTLNVDYIQAVQKR